MGKFRSMVDTPVSLGEFRKKYNFLDELFGIRGNTLKRGGQSGNSTRSHCGRGS